MTGKLTIESILSESEREAKKYNWEGSFSDYLRMVTIDPSICRQAHSLVHDAILSKGSETTPEGDPLYRLFDGEIFGLEDPLERIVQYFSAASQRFEVRKRILLLLGPPASGKSSVVDLIKRSLEDYTRTKQGSVYAIQGCPMQEEPLHLIPTRLRKTLFEQYGIYIEGDLCPRCRYMVRSEYKNQIAKVPVKRVVFSEQEAVGIGYFLANNPNPMDASLLVGSVDNKQLEGDRHEVAGKAFRLDGEMNVANRGLVEFVEMFKANTNMLTTLLSLAQEQLIKMEKFGSVYADEVILGHSNEGDFEEFADDEQSEALKDRIISIQIPYNLRVTEEVKIYQKMLRNSQLGDVHIAPLTMNVSSVFSVLSRLEPPEKQGMSLLDKLRLYDGQMVNNFSRKDTREIQRHHPKEGMSGISPRYVMNRIGAIASTPNITCITPLAALGSLWEGLGENVSYTQTDIASDVALIENTIIEYSDLAVKAVQMSYEESFDQKASELLSSYLSNINTFLAELAIEGRKRTRSDNERERDMREIERVIGITERNKLDFRREISNYVNAWNKRGLSFEYDSEARLKSAIETRLLATRNQLNKSLTRPRFARQRVEWAQKRSAIANRLIENSDYCEICANDLIRYVNHILKGRSVIKKPRNEDIEWQWDRFPKAETTNDNS